MDSCPSQDALIKVSNGSLKRCKAADMETKQNT